VVIGVASTGLHSNGYSLARKIAFEIGGFQVGDNVEELGQTVGEALMTPTQIYVRPMRKVLTYYRVKNVVHGVAHITGGGLHENLARILPEGVQVVIDRSAWPVPPVFSWLQRLGDVEQDEMDQVFNMGLGLVLIVAPFYAESIRHQLARCGLDNWIIGRAQTGPHGVIWGKV
jgi:phosphoribosylformylglycinamidine cyclo-ligase